MIRKDKYPIITGLGSFVLLRLLEYVNAWVYVFPIFIWLALFLVIWVASLTGLVVGLRFLVKKNFKPILILGLILSGWVFGYCVNIFYMNYVSLSGVIGS